ncbi:MAG: hypothetical protein ACOC53_06395 [Candidatus Saliniplasma sp.]
MKNFYKLLEDLLEFEDFELIFSGKGKIVGKSDEEIRSLIVAGERVKDSDLEELEKAEGERILIVFEEMDDTDLKDLPSDVELWDRERLVQKIGEMELEKSVMEGIAEGEKGLVGPDDDLRFDVEHKRKEATLKPIMDFDHVSELGEKQVKGFKYRLELVPHYLFHYKVWWDDGEVSEGRLYLNGISGKRNFWEQPFERVSDIKRSHIKLEPNISKEASSEKAVEAIKDRHLVEMEERWEEEGVTIVEKTENVPSNENIELNEKGIVYVPMWAVEGTEGIVVINAATGKVEREM